jgi:hypothetical protein
MPRRLSPFITIACRQLAIIDRLRFFAIYASPQLAATPRYCRFADAASILRQLHAATPHFSDYVSVDYFLVADYGFTPPPYFGAMLLPLLCRFISIRRYARPAFSRHCAFDIFIASATAGHADFRRRQFHFSRRTDADYWLFMSRQRHAAAFDAARRIFAIRRRFEFSQIYGHLFQAEFTTG